MKRNYYLLIVLFLLSFSSLLAQREIGMAGFHFQVGIPQGGFADAYDQNGYGGDLDLYFRLGPDMPVYAGVNVSFMAFEQYRRRFNNVWLPGGFNQDYRLRVGTSVFSGYGGLRIMPHDGNWRPYAEGLLGFKNFYRSAQLSSQLNNWSSWEVVDTDTEGNWTLAYGGSAGIMIFFNKWFAMDLKCSYLAGQEVTYYQLKDVIHVDDFEENAFSAFERKRSVTDMLIPQIGFVFQLSTAPAEREVYDYTD